jgi:hypothetical protein
MRVALFPKAVLYFRAEHQPKKNLLFACINCENHAMNGALEFTSGGIKELRYIQAEICRAKCITLNQKKP